MSGKKHILFISSWYPTKNDPTHGIFNLYFAQAAALGNKVSVLHVSSNAQQGEFETEESSEGGITTVRVYYKKVPQALPGISAWARFARYGKAFELGYRQLVKSAGTPQLIHLNVVMPAGIGVLRLSKKHGLPYVVNENWSGYCEEDGNYKGFFQKYITQKVIAGAKAVLPTSEFLKQAMLSHGLAGRYEVVPNVVNTQRFVPAPTTREAVTRLIHISSLTDREKNVSGLIRAFAKASEKDASLELVIVGDGEERQSLEELTRSLYKNNKITFKGKLLGNALVEELNAADALVMFSHFETFCLVIIEAFACGKPVITSNAGAIKSYMKPELGLLVEKRDEAQLSQAMLDFAISKGIFNSASIRSYAVQHYSYENVSEQLDRIYEQALTNSSKPAS